MWSELLNKEIGVFYFIKALLHFFHYLSLDSIEAYRF